MCYPGESPAESKVFIVKGLGSTFTQLSLGKVNETYSYLLDMTLLPWNGVITHTGMAFGTGEYGGSLRTHMAKILQLPAIVSWAMFMSGCFVLL